MLVQQVCIISLPRPASTLEPCWPKRIPEIDDARLQKTLSMAATHWLEVRAAEQQAFYAEHDLHVYGPFPTRLMLDIYLSSEHMQVTEEERRGLVRDEDPEEAFSHYLFCADFVVAA